MKFKIVYTSFILALGFFVLTASKNGRASASNAEGNTGAPGDVASNGRTCLNCHNTGAIQVTLDIEVTDPNGAIVTAYTPGETYAVKVRLNTFAGDPSAFGFQMVSEFDADNSTTNSWSDPSSNAKIVGLGGRDYVEQTAPSSSNEFTVNWTAPASGSGNITFYACGNGVNLNNMSSGDGAAINSLTLGEAGMSSVFGQSRTANASVFPNPANNWANIKLEGNVSGGFNLQLFDREGKRVIQELITFEEGQSVNALNLERLVPGIYFLQLMKEGSVVASGKILKQ